MLYTVLTSQSVAREHSVEHIKSKVPRCRKSSTLQVRIAPNLPRARLRVGHAAAGPLAARTVYLRSSATAVATRSPYSGSAARKCATDPEYGDRVATAVA